MRDVAVQRRDAPCPPPQKMNASPSKLCEAFIFGGGAEQLPNKQHVMLKAPIKRIAKQLIKILSDAHIL